MNTYTEADYLRIRYREWKDKVNSKDKLKKEKKNALRFAVELRYSDKTLDRIINAKSDIQISNALHSGSYA